MDPASRDAARIDIASSDKAPATAVNKAGSGAAASGGAASGGAGPADSVTRAITSNGAASRGAGAAARRPQRSDPPGSSGERAPARARRAAARSRGADLLAETLPAKRRAKSKEHRGAEPRPTEAGAGPQDRIVEDGSILVTGICGRLGRLLTRRLHRTDDVIGIDRRPFPDRPKDVTHHSFDLRRKKTRDLFRTGRIRAVVHLGVLHNLRASDREHHSWNVVAFQKLLDYLIQYNVPKLVVLSSANVYGPQPDNPQFLTEEAPLLGAQHFRGIRDLVELDMLAQSFFWRHPGCETVILRPCHILGGVHNAASNFLRLERPVTVLGFDPMVQPIHERDVVDAIVRSLRPGVRGIFNLRGPGELPLSRALRLLGRRPIPVPGALARRALNQMWKYRLTSFPAPELDHIRFVCMVDDQRARQVLGHSPRFDMNQTVHAVDTDR
ncbi:MAG: NAD-dependent epimerase/dehydratase family protein [Myxococcota bacterium]